MICSFGALLAAMQIEQLGVEQVDIQEILDLATGIFAFVLFLLSLYAWSRRRQTPLLIVAGAFLLFLLKEIIELLPQQINTMNLVLNLIDFVALAAFFIAIVIRPRRKDREGG
ncbi:MAG: hypothetical protein ACP5ME_14775 [Anaerolineae bacterium]|jgi:hypothetical protein